MKYFFEKNIMILFCEMIFKNFVLILFLLIFLHCDNVSAKSGYFYNLYCESIDPSQTLPTRCGPVIEGQWQYEGYSNRYNYRTPVFDSMDEVSHNMENYIDNRYHFCKPTRASEAGITPPFIDDPRRIIQDYKMILEVGNVEQQLCKSLFETSNTYRQFKEFTCPDGVKSLFRDLGSERFCVFEQAFNVEISGPSVTQALPSLSGPIIQTIKVNAENGPAKKWSVSVKMTDQLGVSSIVSGLTNDEGIFEFLYVPPFFRASNVILTASCHKCQNTAEKTIYVMGIEKDSLGEPPMCRR